MVMAMTTALLTMAPHHGPQLNFISDFTLQRTRSRDAFPFCLFTLTVALLLGVCVCVLFDFKCAVYTTELSELQHRRYRRILHAMQKEV